MTLRILAFFLGEYLPCQRAWCRVFAQFLRFTFFSYHFYIIIITVFQLPYRYHYFFKPTIFFNNHTLILLPF